MLSYLETVKDMEERSPLFLSWPMETSMEDLGRFILELPDASTPGIKSKEACVQLYLQTFPYASWEHLAGRLFVYGETTELEKVKKRMKPVRGQYNYVLYTIQPCRGSYT